MPHAVYGKLCVSVAAQSGDPWLSASRCLTPARTAQLAGAPAGTAQFLLQDAAPGSAATTTLLTQAGELLSHTLALPPHQPLGAQRAIAAAGEGAGGWGAGAALPQPPRLTVVQAQ